MKKILILLCLCAIVAISSSCNVDEEITTALPPEILLDSETGVYTIKQGREIVIAPNYESAEGAIFCWTMDGEVLGTAPALIFKHEQPGEYFITITITTDGGNDKEEIRVDVVELEIPTVSITGNRNMTVATGTELVLNASVRETSLPTTTVWSINGEKMCEGLSYTFKSEEAGNYTVEIKASNEDGTHSDTVNVEVLNAADMPFVWDFDRTAYHTVEGRKLLIRPSGSSDMEGIRYTWQIDGKESVEGGSSFVFVSDKKGEHTVKAAATLEKEGKEISIAHEFAVTVYEEGAFYRAKGSASKADWNKVYEYMPAPGQFINELKTGGFDGTQTTPEAAVAYAESRMSEVDKNGKPNPIWVSLGGFGGYIVVGFDHSIENSGNYDLAILGNSFGGSSEPGIVWVMQDENGNGLPDDTWYELAGSETGKAETIQDYAVTYYRPSGTGMPVQWTDNMGNSGQIDYLKTYHNQDYYYPLWVTEDSYTLTGTCLKARNYDASGKGTYWVNKEYDWGYADNYSPVDRLTGDANAGASANANHFKISNAIDFECKPVHLDYIDFVKVQVGVNAKSGWLGELSTEVFGFYDYNMKKSAD